MIKKEQLTLLTKEYLPRLRKNENKTIIPLTDFALLTGAKKVHSNYVFNLKENAISHFAVGYTSKGELSFFPITSDYAVLRPVLTNLQEDELGAFLANEKKDGTIDLGRYPRSVVSPKEKAMLDELYQKNLCVKTKHNFHFQEQKKEGISFSSCFTYQYQDHEYIRVKSKLNEDQVLSDGTLHTKNTYEWVRVEPITWYIDKKSRSLIAKEGMLSGIPFYTSSEDFLFFEESVLNSFLNDYFFNDIFEYIPFEKEETVREYVLRKKVHMEDFSSYNTALKTGSISLKDCLDDALFIYSKIKNETIYSMDPETKTGLLWDAETKIGFSFLWATIVHNKEVRMLFEQYKIKLSDLEEAIYIEEEDAWDGKIATLSKEEKETLFEQDFKPFLRQFQSESESAFKRYQIQPNFSLSPLSFAFLPTIKRLLADILCVKKELEDYQTYLNHPFVKELVPYIGKDWQLDVSSLKEEKEDTPPLRRPSEKHRGNTALTKYGSFLNDQVYYTNPAIGREKELRRLMLGLLTKEKSCALVGPAGVGKTAIVEGLAYLIQKGDVPIDLQNYDILKVNTSRLLSGTIYRGQFEERVEKLLREIAKDKSILLFIDELHTVIGSGKGEQSSLDFANMLKPYIDRGQIKIIGATTVDEYARYIEKDPALKRRFRKVKVEEPTKEVLSSIIEGKMEDLSKRMKVEIPFEDTEKEILIDHLCKVTEPSCRSYNDKLYNPDLVLSLVDTAFACARYENRKQLEMNDFIEAIDLEDRLYESSRKRICASLFATFEELKNEKEKTAPVLRKVISFWDIQAKTHD